LEQIMSRSICPLLLALAVSGTIAGQQKRADDESRELDGVWLALTRKLNGKETLSSEPPVKLVLVGDRFFLIAGDRVGAEGTARFDRGRKPKIIDITMKSQERKGQTDLGIYQIVGDTLRMCFVTSNRPRLAEFPDKSREGDFIIYWEFKRESP